MKQINYSNIAPGIAQPFLKDTWDYLQTGLHDALAALAKGLIGDDIASGVNILWGCKVISPTQVSSGWVYYNGELYACTGWNGVVTDTLVGVLVTGYSGNDPVKFSDGSMHNVHENKYVVLNDAVSGSGIADLSDFKNIYNIPYIQVNSGGTAPAYQGAFIDPNDFPAVTKFRKTRAGQYVELILQCQSTDTTDSIIHIFTLPTGYIPYNDIKIPVNNYDQNGMTPVSQSSFVVIFGRNGSTPGKVYVLNYDCGGGNYFTNYAFGTVIEFGLSA